MRIYVCILCFVVVVVPLIDSLGCNYYISSKTNSKKFGLGDLEGQCQLGFTQLISKFEDGIIVNAKTFSFVILDRIVFIETSKEVWESEVELEKSQFLSVPLFYTVKFKRYDQKNVFVISPKPRSNVQLVRIDGHYSFMDRYNK